MREREIIIYATINNIRASAQLARWPLAGAAGAASNQNFTAGRSKQVAYTLTTASWGKVMAAWVKKQQPGDTTEAVEAVSSGGK